VRYSRQIVGEPLQPQAMQLDPGEPRPVTVISALVPRIAMA
jgi:hypothetical protein